MNERQRELIEKAGLDIKDFEPAEILQIDRIEAQTLYTALMTDTMLEEEEDE